MGIDPATHKPKTNIFGSGQPKDTANLSHMAQWESARLEAEARLVRESKLMSTMPPPTKATFLPPCLDILKAWQATRKTAAKNTTNPFFTSNGSLQSPTSTLNFSDNILTISRTPRFGENMLVPIVNHVEKSKTYEGVGSMTKENVPNNWKSLGKLNRDDHQLEVMDNVMQLDHDIDYPNPVDDDYIAQDSLRHPGCLEGFAGILSDEGNNSTSPVGPYHNLDTSSCGGDLEDDRKYWNDILSNAVTFTSGSPIF